MSSYLPTPDLIVLCLTFLGAMNMACASYRAVNSARLQVELESLKKNPTVQPDKPWPRD